MGISVTPNSDGSYTVECGTEKLTFIPSGTSPVRTRTGNDELIDPGGNRHRAAIVVPFGLKPDPVRGTSRIPGHILIEEIGDWTQQIQDALQLPRVTSPISDDMLMLNVPTGTKVDIGKLLSSANEAAETQGLDHLDIFLTGEFFKK